MTERRRDHATASGWWRLAGLVACLAAAGPSAAPAQAPKRPQGIFVDGDGVLRWADDRREVRLFGANYVLPGASDYRAAGYVGADRKRTIDVDMAHFARMGWDGLRLTFWGDWEASDSLGNLLRNEHLDLLDWLVAKARARGISMLLSPIQLYQSTWPDALADTSPPGFGRRHDRSRMGTDPAAIAAQANYLRQLLEHVNPYTGLAYKDEPAILFIELVNEPVHHPEDLEGSVRYIDTLVEAVRRTGCTKPVVYNVSQDMRIAGAVRHSAVQGVTYGWYPTGLNAGHELAGNFLRAVDDYPDLRDSLLRGLPRIVYEFDAPDTRSAAMYPAMARTFRAGGVQFAAMFSYDMLPTASRNLGWQTHYLNLAYTPRKAMGGIIAAEVMRRLPRHVSWGTYPANTRFGDFRVSGEPDHAELVAEDAFLYSATTRSAPPSLASLRRIAGLGSSPVVEYDGEGIYFLDRIRPGVWRLEVYPDAVPVRDPFEMPSPGKLVTRAIHRSWPMTLRLPDLGGAFSVQSLQGAERAMARDGRFVVRPGIYLLSGTGPVEPRSLPERVGTLGLTEFHGPLPDSLPLSVEAVSASTVLSGRAAEVRVRVVDDLPPDSVALFLGPAGKPFERRVRMDAAGGYTYRAALEAAHLPEGEHRFAVAAYRGGAARSFPAGVSGTPWDWDWHQRAAWPLHVVQERTALRLFDPRDDIDDLAFSRLGDGGRRGVFRVGQSARTGAPVFHLAFPGMGSGPEGDDYTASLVIRDRVLARGGTMAAADAIRLRVRGLGERQTLHLALMEVDGTSWTAQVTVDGEWRDVEVPLTAFTAGRGVMLPQGFPRQWNYWVPPAAGRGGPADRVQVANLERIQFSLRPPGGRSRNEAYGVELEWALLAFDGAAP